MARDLMGNESDPSIGATHFLKATPSWLGAGGKASGILSAIWDIDAFTLGLVEGDVLNVKPQTKSAEKKKVLVLDLDVVSPSGEQFIVGQYPEDAKKPGITGWVVPKTGRYLVVLRVARENTAPSGSYKLKVKVKQAKANKKVAGEFTGTEIPFDAVDGSKFKASLKGGGIDPGDVTLVGPDGPVTIEVTGKPGSVKIKGVLLRAGTGAYAIRLASSATVNAKLCVKLPKIKGTVGE
jgi:RNase P/RNase MRP subunit p29